MKRYTVTGMTCAACSARVDKSVRALEGVTDCSVNLLTGDMAVEGNISDSAIIAAVSSAGYGAVAKDSDKKSNVLILFHFAILLSQIFSIQFD